MITKIIIVMVKKGLRFENLLQWQCYELAQSHIDAIYVSVFNQVFNVKIRLKQTYVVCGLVQQQNCRVIQFFMIHNN